MNAGKHQPQLPVRWLSVLACLAIWQLSVVLFQPDLLPSPVAVTGRLLEEWHEGELLWHLWVTLYRVAASFFIALALGLLLGGLMGAFPAVDTWLDAPLTIGLNIPALVVVILSFLWLGLNEFAVVTAVILNKTPTMTVIFREGVRAIDQGLMEVGRVHRLSPRKLFLHLWLPQLYPYFLSATRSGLALVWKIVLVVELLGASEGMGFKLGEFFQFFDIEAILAYAFAFVAVIMGLEALVIRPWESRVMAWRST